QRPGNVKMQQASTYQRDPTDVAGNPSNQLQTNDVAHGETLLGCTEQANGRLRFPGPRWTTRFHLMSAGLGQAETSIVPHVRTPVVGAHLDGFDGATAFEFKGEARPDGDEREEPAAREKLK